MHTTNCPRCGHRNPAGQRHCHACKLELTPARPRHQFWIALSATVLVGGLLLLIGGVLVQQFGLLPALPQQQAVAPADGTPTDLPAGAAPIQTQQAIERDNRRTTATAASLKATADVAQVSTSIARQASGAPPPPAAGTPTSVRPTDLYDLPLYPGAQPIDPNDPIWQGRARSNTPVLGGYGQVNQAVYTIPTGNPSSAVLAYYQQNLALFGWQTANTTAVQAVGTQQNIFARDRQQLIVTLVTVPNAANITDATAPPEKTYLLVTLVTSQ